MGNWFEDSSKGLVFFFSRLFGYFSFFYIREVVESKDFWVIVYVIFVVGFREEMCSLEIVCLVVIGCSFWVV